MADASQEIEAHVANELGRVRDQLRVLIAESDYTLDQVAAFAGIGRSTLHALLSGAHVTGGGLDTYLRVLFVLGGNLDLSGGENRSFQLVPLVTGNRHSSESSAVAAPTARGRQKKRDNVPDRAVASTRKSRDQRGKGARRKPTNTRYLILAA